MSKTRKGLRTIQQHLEELTARALDVLTELLESKDRNVRLQAARIILQHASHAERVLTAEPIRLEAHGVLAGDPTGAYGRVLRQGEYTMREIPSCVDDVTAPTTST